MTNNFDQNEIINDEEFKKMLNSNDYEEVYELLRNYSVKIASKFSFNNELQNKLRDRLFIYYLMVSKQIYRRRNMFEKVLIKMNSNLSNDILDYLLSQDLDMNYIGYDLYGNITSLIDELALHTNNPKYMNIVLSKMDGINRKEFSNEYYNLHTDLCRMNIVAGNIDKSLEIFNDENYKLFSNDVNDGEISEKLSIVKNGIFVNELNGEESDKLLQIIKTLENAEIEIDLKRIFLNKILHSNKIKLFNTSNLSSIQNIFSEEEYNKFVEYLYNKIDLKQITAYSNSDNKNIIFYESLRTLTEKPKYL